jgi:hypothetical protein
LFRVLTCQTNTVARADIFRRLDSVIKHSESRSPENVHATENAISAVAKIIRFQSSAIDVRFSPFP